MQKKPHKINWSSLSWGTILLLIPLAFILLFYFLPLGSILKRLFQEVSAGLQINWTKIGKVFSFTTWQALLSMGLTVLLGLPAAWIFSRYQFRGKKVIASLLSVPFILPTVVTAAAFSALVGPKGWLNVLLMNLSGAKVPPIRLMNTLTIIILAHIFYNISVVIRIVGNAWIGIDTRLEDAGRTLGCSPWQTFWKITFPLLKPAIYSAILLVFLFDFTSYGVVLLLGGVKFATIEVEIAQQALSLFNLPMAGLLSVLQILITVLVTLADTLISKSVRSNRIPRIQDENLKKPSGFAEKGLLVLILGGLMVFLMAPLLALLLRSFIIFSADVTRGITHTGWTLDYYRQLFINQRTSFFYVPPIQAVVNSLVTAFIAAFISVTIGLLITVAADRYAWTRKLNPVFMFPLGTSAVTLGLGYLLFFSSNIKNPLLIPFAHSLIGLPFVIRSLRPALSSIPLSIHQAGSMLGAGPLDIFLKIDIPILMKGIANAGIFAFTISLGEFGATSFISMPERPTIPIAIYRFLGQPGTWNYGQAMAMSTILMVFCVIGIWIFENSSFTKNSDLL